MCAYLAQPLRYLYVTAHINFLMLHSHKKTKQTIAACCNPSDHRNAAPQRDVVMAIGEGLPAPVKAYIYYRKGPIPLSANYTWLPSGDWLEVSRTHYGEIFYDHLF